MSKYDVYSVEDLIEKIINETEYQLPVYNRDLRCYEGTVPDYESNEARKEFDGLLRAMKAFKLIRCYTYRECIIEMLKHHSNYKN